MLILTAAVKAFLSATIVTLLVWLTVTVVWKKKGLLIPLAVVYILAILYITLFSRVVADEGQGVNFLPFRFIYWIRKYAEGPTYHGIFRPMLGVYLNILMFVPLGFLVKTWKPTIPNWKIILAGFIFSLFIELAQMIFHLGMFETDDLMTNTLGTWLGIVFYKKRMEKA